MTDDARWSRRRSPGALQCCATDVTARPHLFEVMVCVADHTTLCIELHAVSLRTYVDSNPITVNSCTALWEP